MARNQSKLFLQGQISNIICDLPSVAILDIYSLLFLLSKGIPNFRLSITHFFVSIFAFSFFSSSIVIGLLGIFKVVGYFVVFIQKDLSINGHIYKIVSCNRYSYISPFLFFFHLITFSYYILAQLGIALSLLKS